MDETKKAILRIPETVREDVLSYRENVGKFLRGETKPISFKAYRVPMGIYEQRQEGKFMVRIRIGAGLALPGQLQRIADLSKKHGSGIVHVTTRQDIQIHEVAIEDTPDVLEGLLEVGLSARGGGGNTVRNITACPRAGICPNERFDVAPYSIAAAEYLLQNRTSFNLPRKYKIVFSGCSQDCALASVADLGFFAADKNGEKGFSVYAAGGMGGSPNVAVKIEDFVEAGEIFKVAEAIKRLFDKHGDRSNKHKARLRFVLARLGYDEFLRLYKDQMETLTAEGLSDKVPDIRDVGSDSGPLAASENNNGFGCNVMPEKIPGRSSIRLRLKLGDISADDLSKAATIAEDFGSGPVRTTQLQDLLICGVEQKNIERAAGKLKQIGLDPAADTGPKVVSCTGAATCKLGLCLSRGLADAVSEKLREIEIGADYSDTIIRISGCPNSCGHHLIASIGFQGRAKRVNGRLMPCYDVMAGGVSYQGKSKLAEKIGTVPAKKIPEMLAEAFAASAVDKKGLEKIVKEFDDFIGADLSEDLYCDFGSTEPFSLAGRGPGECGAGVMDIIKVDIDEASAAIKAAEKVAEPRQKSDLLYNAIAASCRALLVVFGLEPKKDREIFVAFGKNLIEPGWVKADTQQLIDAALDFKLGDRASISDSAGEAEELVERVRELFDSLDAALKFTVTPAEVTCDQEQSGAEQRQVDLRGVACPLNFVKAKIALEQIDISQTLEFLVDAGEPVRNVPASFTEQGQEVISVEENGEHFVVKVRRIK